ncbi:MAG: hypothetical protein HY654_03255 [Acidobacteria bacterium]|nr:hypothetical protein [Acidobacteriota bacterium]
MARRRNAASRNGTLQDAIALLVQNQAALVAQHTSFLTELRELAADSARRFATIEQELRQFEQIKAILLRHEQILNELPEAIRQRIGFKGP